MGLFSRTPAVTVEVSPPVVTPRQLVTARVSAASPVDKVTSATLEWGYTNFYRYHWAGRADSAVAQAGDALWMYGDVGTNAGGDRDTKDWVGVTKVALSLDDFEFFSGTAEFRIPSWAPASSPEIADWSARVVIERGGRDVDVHGQFVVRIGRDDVSVPDATQEVVMGDAETVIDIDLDESVCLAGRTIRGRVRLMPTRDLPDADVAVCWRRCRESHPLTRTPTAGGEYDGPVLRLGKRIPLRTGSPVTLPFDLELPADAPPTASAVHSSMKWFVHARLFYAGISAHLPERVVRPIAVVNVQ